GRTAMIRIEWLRRASLAAALALVGCGGGDGASADGADAGGGGGGPGWTPIGTWEWTPVDGTRCMNDTPTGFAINGDPASGKLLLYLEGGGACFNVLTCSSVAHQNGFDESEFEQMVASYGG